MLFRNKKVDQPKEPGHHLQELKGGVEVHRVRENLLEQNAIDQHLQLEGSMAKMVWVLLMLQSEKNSVLQALRT